MAIEDIERLKEKIEKDPNSKLFVPLAEEYKKTGMLDEAIEVLIKGLERQPTYLSARVSLGKIYIERGSLDEAKAEFEKVIAVIPDNLYAHKKLAEIYKDLAEKDNSIRELKTVLRLNPGDEWAATTLASLGGASMSGPHSEPAQAPAQKPVSDSEEILPVTEEALEISQAGEEEPLAGDERLPDTALTARDLELSSLLAGEDKEEAEQGNAEAEVQSAGVEDDFLGTLSSPPETVEEEALDIQFGNEGEEPLGFPSDSEETVEEETPDIQFGSEGEEPLGFPSDSEETVEEETPDIQFGNEEAELWDIPSELVEPSTAERESPPKKAISKEDMDLWKSHLETVEETVEPSDEKAEPSVELDQLAGEEAVAFQDIFEEPEPLKQPAFEAQQTEGQALEDADKWIQQEKYGEALKIYRTMLSAHPDSKHVHQRLEELRALLKLLGKDKDELVARLERLLEGIKKRRDEFSGTA